MRRLRRHRWRSFTDNPRWDNGLSTSSPGMTEAVIAQRTAYESKTMICNAEPSEPTFRIGAVSRMTGLSTDTIRAWERRYSVVEPLRTLTHNRLYSRGDIARLALIKRLVDAGDRIGMVGQLSLEALQARLEAHEAHQTVAAKTKRPPRVAILGDALPAQLYRESVKPEGLEIVAIHRERRRFELEVGDLRADELVLEYPTIHEGTVHEIQSLLETSRAAHACVVYGFGPQRVIRKLETSATTPLRAPVDLAELTQVIIAAAVTRGHDAQGPATPANGNGRDSVPQRRYEDEALTRIATAANPVKCECPYHLVDLIRSLTAFEKYCAECENQNTDDAALHTHLHVTTAQARSMLEGALTRVAQAEGLGV